jgi:hypothetical protein
VDIGVGHGPSKKAGKRTASVQALEYLRSYGKAPKYKDDRAHLILKFSATGGNILDGAWSGAWRDTFMVDPDRSRRCEQGLTST